MKGAKEKMRRQKGITLVALVVTIIILIILAATSINLLLGEHGLISMAKRAKENTQQSQIDEQTGLNELFDEILLSQIDDSELPEITFRIISGTEGKINEVSTGWYVSDVELEILIVEKHLIL